MSLLSVGALRRVTALLFAGAALPAFAQPTPSAEMDRLAAAAAQKGSVRVIVGVNAPFQAEGFLSDLLAARQRNDLKAMQASVERYLAGTQFRVQHHFSRIPYSALEVDANALARLRASGEVRSIEEDRLAKPQLAESTALINAPSAWSAGNGGEGWTVAVLDTGVDKNHPFLAGKVVAEACFSSTVGGQSSSVCPGGAASSTAAGSGLPCTSSTSCDHGTHVAGIVAGANGPNGANGVAKGANLLAVQVFSWFPSENAVLSYTSDQLKALEHVYALRDTYKIASVNMSLGGGAYTGTCDASNPSLKAAIDNLRSAGIATVIAAGNGFATNAISAPACISSAISVGATCDAAAGSYCTWGQDYVAGYSNIASFVSLVAPGSLITSSVTGGGYGAKNGTSMAAPHVAGAWAILKKAQPDLSVADALAHLRTNAVTVNDQRSGATVTGLKRINLAKLPGPPSGYTLAITRQGTGSGSVVSAPAGIACGVTCTASFATGSSVTLTAAPTSGSTFTGWSGSCSGTQTTCTVSMTQARSVVAGFATLPPVPQTLTVSRQGTGAGMVLSSPAGINCGSVCTATYNSGTGVLLQAVASAGSTFAGWSGACTGTGSCIVPMSAARNVVATFNTVAAPTTFALAVSRGGTGTGTVTSAPAGISCGATCNANFSSGTSVTLTAAPAQGSTFAGWTGACTGTATSCVVPMTQARSVGATFNTAPVGPTPSYLLSVSTSGSGAGTVSSNPAGISCGATCSASFTSGTSVTLTAAPANGSVFGGWSGACSGTASTCTVPMNAAANVGATFNPAPTGGSTYALTVTRIGSGRVTSAPAGIDCGTACTAQMSGPVTLTATPAAGKFFLGWSGACMGMQATCNVSMTAARSVFAMFSQ